MHQVLIEDFGIDTKKYLPEQLGKELKKHIETSHKKD